MIKDDKDDGGETTKYVTQMDLFLLCVSSSNVTNMIFEQVFM